MQRYRISHHLDTIDVNMAIFHSALCLFGAVILNRNIILASLAIKIKQALNLESSRKSSEVFQHLLVSNLDLKTLSYKDDTRQTYQKNNWDNRNKH